MNKTLINQAAKALTIHDVCLHSSEMRLSEQYDPVFSEYESLSLQTRHGPRDSQIMAARGKDEENSQRILRVRYECAFRLASPELSDDVLNNEEEAQKYILAEVHATFAAYYFFHADVIKDAVDEFAKYNVGYHVWPYWREYASSIASRMRFPHFAVPLYTLPDFGDEGSESHSTESAPNAGQT